VRDLVCNNINKGAANSQWHNQHRKPDTDRQREEWASGMSGMGSPFRHTETRAEAQADRIGPKLPTNHDMRLYENDR
jgi:hypothetical protein